jgi:hypothetical protein
MELGLFDLNYKDILEYSIKSCPVGPELRPSFDVSSPPGCCPQSHEILLNKGMKYWHSGWNAPGSTTFIATVHIAAAVIGGKRSGKERTGQTQFSTKFAPKLSFMSCWIPVYFFFPVFWNLVPYVTKQGVPVPFLPNFTDNFVVNWIWSSKVCSSVSCLLFFFSRFF